MTLMFILLNIRIAQLVLGTANQVGYIWNSNVMNLESSSHKNLITVTKCRCGIRYTDTPVTWLSVYNYAIYSCGLWRPQILYVRSTKVNLNLATGLLQKSDNLWYPEFNRIPTFRQYQLFFLLFHFLKDNLATINM